MLAKGWIIRESRPNLSEQNKALILGIARLSVISHNLGRETWTTRIRIRAIRVRPSLVRPKALWVARSLEP